MTVSSVLTAVYSNLYLTMAVIVTVLQHVIQAALVHAVGQTAQTVATAEKATNTVKRRAVSASLCFVCVEICKFYVLIIPIYFTLL